MTSVALKLNTIDQYGLRSVDKAKQQIEEGQRSIISGKKYQTTSKMSLTERQQHQKLQNRLGNIMLLDRAAKDFSSKAESAVGAVQHIQDKVAELNKIFTKYGFDISTAQAKAEFSAAINSALTIAQSELNSTDDNGNYVFASGMNLRAKPVGDIINTKNYLADNIPNASYLNGNFTVNQVDVSESLSVDANFNAGDPAFMNTIASLHMMLDAINQNSNTIPQDVYNLFAQSQQQVDIFLANLDSTYQNVEDAMEQVEKVRSDIEYKIDAMFDTDPVENATEISQHRTAISGALDVIGLLLKLPHLSSLLFSGI